MKKIFTKSILIPVIFSGIFWGCASDEVNAPNTVKPVEIPEAISAGTNKFAFDFFHKLQKTQPAGDNIFVSPLSLHMALGMLVNGAEGETKEELLTALQVNGINIDELNKAYSTLINGLPEADSKVKLGLANSVWYRENLQVETSFKNVLLKSFDAQVTGLPFNDAAKDKINQWASDKTEGKIKQVLDKIESDQVMFLLNALYFKGDWKSKFDSKDTKDEPFKFENGTEKQVKMMHVKSDFKSGGTADFQAVQLPYANGQFNMTLLVPSGNNTVASVIEGLSEAKWKDLQATGMAERGVEVGLPRFSLDYEVMLNGTLQKMGIARSFLNNAQFGGISKSQRLKVDFVKQNTYLGIDEKGTEAAAVTTIAMVVLSAGPATIPKIIADRPFVMVISEKTSNTILFMGSIMNPDSK